MSKKPGLTFTATVPHKSLKLIADSIAFEAFCCDYDDEVLKRAKLTYKKLTDIVIADEGFLAEVRLAIVDVGIDGLIDYPYDNIRMEKMKCYTVMVRKLDSIQREVQEARKLEYEKASQKMINEVNARRLRDALAVVREAGYDVVAK